MSGDFPPSEPTSTADTISSYLYQEYSDDDDLQAFVGAFNEIAQYYVDWFNGTGLPIYTGAAISGDLLDWVAEGLYGISRPALPSGLNQDVGPFNTYALNDLAYNGSLIVGPQNYVATSDDTFKRIMTWHFYKGDGKVFSVEWLKRRVMRFLLGVNGTAPSIDNTYQVSVTFGVGKQVDIRILNGLRTVTSGAIYNEGFGFNAMAFNEMNSTFAQFAPLSDAPIFQSAVAAGVLELPFQFTYVVTIT